MSSSSTRTSPPRRYASSAWEEEEASHESSRPRAAVGPLRFVDISNVGPAASPLEQLGRLAGTARKGSLEAVPSSEASTSTLRPQLQSTSSSPLVFNSFRNSTASESSTYYTSSIYSNSEDNHAYWEGRRPEDDVDQSDEDDARTERGGDDERDDVEDDDGDTTVDDHGGGLSQHHYYESVGLRAEDSTGNSPNFTTSSRISRLLLDSAQDDEDQDPDASFGSQWSASSAYSSASSRQQLSRQELSQSVDSNPSYEYSSSPPPLSPTPSPPSLIRNASIGGVSQRRAEVIRPQIEISSVYGDAGNQWDGGGEAWNRATPPRPSFPSEPSRGGPSPSSPGSGNFSRPMKVSGAGVISPLAGVSSASRQKGVAGGGDYIDPPQRSASLRRKAGGGGDASQLSRSPSPTWTPSTFEHDRKSVDPVPFSQHPNPSPTPSSTVPSPSFSPRLPSNLRQQSSSSTSSRPHSPPPTSPVSPTTPYGPPRPKFAANTFGSSSSVSSISSLPTRRAPPPPVDRPAYNGKLAALDQATTRLVPSSNQPYRQAHPSNGATHWQPTLPSSTPTTSTKFTPQLPSQRKSTYPPNPSLPHQSTYLQQENLSSSSQRIRAYSESEQNYSSPDDPSARPGLSPLTGTSSGRPSFAAVPPKPSFTVTSRDRSGSASSSSATSPLSQQSSSSSDREIVGTPSSLKLSPGTSRAELHPGLFSVYELGPSSRSASPTRESFQPPKGSYTHVEVIPADPSSSSSSSQSHSHARSPSPPPQRMGPEQYLKLGIQHHSNAEDLSLAAMYFREAATFDGGCPGGMLFYGLTLRSGWGVVKDEKKGFEWLRRACEPAAAASGGKRRGSAGGEGGGMGGGGTEPAALAPEMVVAILEVAQCFLHGWGCAKDPEKAVNYLLVAAKMGDVDAQLQLASCYLHGLGTKGKKDKIQSAFWFRAAIAQGASDAGLSWVYKKKYIKE